MPQIQKKLNYLSQIALLRASPIPYHSGLSAALTKGKTVTGYCRLQGEIMTENTTWDLKCLFLKMLRNALQEAIFWVPDERTSSFFPFS